MIARTAAIIPNYNMPERADTLATYIREYCLSPVDVIVVDNGSDLVPPPASTVVQLKKNVQTTGAFLAGLKHADELAERQGYSYYAYWFLITSTEFVDQRDNLTPMVDWLYSHPHAVGIHPALTADSTTSWTHMLTRGGDQPRRTWMIDNIAALYRADWFDGISRFDPRMVYAWGIDLETCWRARFERKSLWIDERCRVKKVTNIGYLMQRMNMSADDRSRLAGDNMRKVLKEKYGRDYWRIMTEAGVQDEWR